jgi:hypothetical protein
VVAAAKSIVWIASYPKSGNTWVRFLTCNLIFGPVDSAAALNSLAPDLHELRALPPIPHERILMKTHFVYSSTMPGAMHTAGALYVVRDPADVMLSNFHYARRSNSVAGGDATALNRYVDSFIAARGDPRWTSQGMGTWEDNVRSWLHAGRDFPMLAIRYEDLVADPSKVAESICRHLEIERTPEEVAQAVAASGFDRLRAIEEADIAAQRVGIFYKPYLLDSVRSGLRFMRAGKSGEAERVLTDEQRQRVAAAFGSIRREAGYV